MNNLPSKQRILILGGGFAGIATARHLEKLFRRRRDVEIVLVCRDNFVLMTPLLFEVFSGTLDLKSCSVPIRAFLRSARFVEATVQNIELDNRTVRLVAAGTERELAYDQLVIALGSKTNRAMIPGSEHAFTFKTLADALLLRNYVIERFERADVETDPQRKAQLLTFVIIGGGLVGVELLGELSAFVNGIVPLYKQVNRNEVRLVLLQGADRIMPEIDSALAEYGARVLAARRGVEVRTNVRVQAIEPNKVHMANETIAADTIVLAAGVVPSPVVADLPIAKDKSGRIVVESTMQNREHAEVWALGDLCLDSRSRRQTVSGARAACDGEAKVLAANIQRVLDGKSPKPFIHDNLGMMGSLGHNMGFAQFLKIRMRGRPAWFARRTYYLLQMPGWSRRLRMIIDWTFGLLFRPDVVKVGLDTETASLLREVAIRDLGSRQSDKSGTPPEPAP